MSDKQLSERELALLIDLSRLLKKHGSDVFDSLAATLADPEFSGRLSMILDTVSTNAPRRQATGRPRPRRSASDRISIQLRNADAEHTALLRPIVDSLIAGESLPRLKDVAEFALTVGLPAPRGKARADAVVDVVRALVAMPTDELEKVLPALMVSTDRGERSLEGWNRIIERSRAATYGRQASRGAEPPRLDR